MYKYLNRMTINLNIAKFVQEALIVITTHY